MSVKVEVRLLGIFQRLTGRKTYHARLQEPATVRQLITKLAEFFPEEFKQVLIDSHLDDPRPNALIVIGGKEIGALQGLDTEVKVDDKIVLIPRIHGG